MVYDGCLAEMGYEEYSSVNVARRNKLIRELPFGETQAGPLRRFRYSEEWEGLTDVERHHRAQNLDPRFMRLRPSAQELVWELIEEKGPPKREPLAARPQ
jgi:hypothetical protein